MSNVPPDEHEQHFDEEARKFHADAIHIKDASDGVQAFVVIICAGSST